VKQWEEGSGGRNRGKELRMLQNPHQGRPIGKGFEAPEKKKDAVKFTASAQGETEMRGY